MIIKGSVENILFRNEENGYTVLNFCAEGGRYVTARGFFPSINEGETYALIGEYVVHSKFGEQFEVTEATFESPTDEAGILNYLASGLFRGVGEVTARAIVDRFGTQALKVIEETPERLKEVSGIGAAKAREIEASYREHVDAQRVILFLQKYGIPMSQALKIQECYGEQTIEKITDNPYRLVDDIDGIGFVTADNIAEKLGVNRDSDFRIMAGISHVLKEEASRSGHTYLPEAMLIDKVNSLIDMDDSDRINKCLSVMTVNCQIKPYKFKDEDGKIVDTGYAQAINYNTENAIAAKLLKLNASAKDLDIDADKEIAHFEKLRKITLHQKQRDAVSMAVNKGVVVLTGGPGTGKTTIVKCIMELLTERGLKVMLTAPTGRAAKKLSEATSCEAKTLHRLLGIEFSTGKPVCKFNEFNNISADAIIVDEISMADIFIFNSLLSAMPSGARLVMVGDKDQLPSVSAGNVLSDVIASNAVPVAELTEIYRQDAGSLIVYNAHLINNGEMPVLNNHSKDFFVDNVPNDRIVDDVITLLSERIPSHFHIEQSDIQVLCPMKKGVAGTVALNKAIQNALNPEGKSVTINDFVLRIGDKVMHVVNNYELKWERNVGYMESGEGVFNGDIGYIREITGGELIVEFDDGKIVKYSRESQEELMPAYAVSVHKSQGSEFKAVILVLTSGGYMLLNRNLLYTAVTRAKDLVVIVGNPAIIKKMVDNNYIAKRYSLLKEFIWENQKKQQLLKGLF